MDSEDPSLEQGLANLTSQVSHVARRKETIWEKPEPSGAEKISAQLSGSLAKVYESAIEDLNSISGEIENLKTALANKLQETQMHIEQTVLLVRDTKLAADHLRPKVREATKHLGANVE